ncbi:MAG: glycogen/starch synthase [Muribaculaceae bacterium]|nr:glycogen/starch synthase [Muribaculaceae bacterium]
MSKQKILYISQEITPYLPKDNLSYLGQHLPQAIQEYGYEVRTFMPKYGLINERRNQLHEVIRLSGMNIVIDDTDHPLIIKVATLQPSRMQVYFIDNDDYFDQHGIDGLEINIHPSDNDERSIFFIRGVMETVKKLRWEPAIINCLGWITALAPLYIKTRFIDDPAFRSSKVIYALYNEPIPEDFDPRFVEKLLSDGFTEEQIKSLITPEGRVDNLAINKIAIDYADAVVVSSENVDPRIIDYAVESGKPLLPFNNGDNFEHYATFYASL